MNVELDFICDVCGGPVADNHGSLYLRFAALHEYRNAKAEWEATQDPGGAIDVIGMLMLPGPAPWLIHHDRCRPDESDGYHIAVEQVRTWRDLLRWTAHLMPKNWLPDTNWGSVIDAAAEGRDRRIVAVDVRGEVA